MNQESEPESEPAKEPLEVSVSIQPEEKKAEKAAPPENPQLTNLSRSKKTSLLSLTSIEKRKAEEAALAAKKQEQELLLRAQELPNESFAEEHFFKVWDEYIHLLHEQGERIFASVLNSKRPELQQNQIRFTCTNKIMKAELEKVRPKALQYLREKLNNYSLEFDIAITEEETSKLVYTNQEKYEYLREKNEAIAYLRKVFKLDL